MGKKKSGGNAGGDENNNGGKDDKEIVFKLNLHCDGCRSKIRKSILSFHGVKEVEFEGDFKLKIVTWMNVDPLQLQKRLQKKTTKTVEILSPLPKKEKDDNKPQKSEPKEKETPITTVVLKVAWHCNGCGDRIHKAISSYKGVYEVSIDKEKDLVIVKGKMDSKKMVEVMREKLRKPVEIVPEMKQNVKEKDKKDGGDNNKEDHNKGGGGRKGSKADKSVFGSGTFGSGHIYEDESGQVVAPYYAPQLFSDENPNACSLM